MVRPRIAEPSASPPRSAALTAANFARAASMDFRATSTRARSCNNCSPSKKQPAKESTTSSSWEWANRWQTSKTLIRAIRIINAPWGLEIGARHITVSTSGLAPQIRKLADEPLQSRLAISLHGATDEVRNRIMPVNRKYRPNDSSGSMRLLREPKKQRIYFEYILIAGVNDVDEQAHFLAGSRPTPGRQSNLIPYNTVEGLDWSRPSADAPGTIPLHPARTWDGGDTPPRKRP